MSATAAPATKAVNFQIKDYQVVGKGNILGRFDMVVDGLGTIFKCGLFSKKDGTGLFVNLPSVNIGRWEPNNPHPNIKMGSIDRDLNQVYTAAAEQAHAAELARLNSQAAGAASA